MSETRIFKMHHDAEVTKLRERIAELELGHKILDAQREKHKKARGRAEAALAERDRMLGLACIDLARDSKEWHEQRDSYDTGYDAAYFLADLRARAEEGSE